MTIDQIKAEAKARYGQDITDEAAKTLLEKYPDSALTDGVLEDVAGGIVSQWPKKPPNNL